MQIKTTMNLPPSKFENDPLSKRPETSTGEGVKKTKSFYIVGGNADWSSPYRKEWGTIAKD